jgi:BlaI family transcriptional regulator, penicillinase repressor
MAQPKLSRFELKVLEMLWAHGALPIRDIQEQFPAKGRPAYTTVQTIVYRLEAKGAVRRAKKIGNAHIFEAVISPNTPARPPAAKFLSLFRGETQLLMAHFIKTGKLTLKDVQDAEALLRELSRKRKQK